MTLARSLALSLAVSLLLSSPVAARQQDPKQRARVLFRQANKLFSRGMYLDALQEYREAQKLYRSFKIDLNIGATLDAMGRRTEAAAFIERFLVQSASAPAEIINAATKRLTELKKKLSSVKVSSLVEGATLRVDGKAVGKTPIELPIYLEPGSHELTLEREGHLPTTRKLDLAAGQHESMDLTPRVPPPPPTRPAVMPPPVPTGPDPSVIEARRRSKTIWAYSTLGVGVALAATASVLYGVGASQGGSAHDKYREATDPDEMAAHYDDVESAKTKLLVGHVLMGAAAAAVGVSIYMFLTRPTVESRSVRVGFFPARGGGLVGVEARF